MTVSTTPTHPSPIEDCVRKRKYTTKRSAKLSARTLRGKVNVYECPHPNPDGTTHWHVTRRRPVPPHARESSVSASV